MWPHTMPYQWGAVGPLAYVLLSPPIPNAGRKQGGGICSLECSKVHIVCKAKSHHCAVKANDSKKWTSEVIRFNINKGPAWL